MTPRNLRLVLLHEGESIQRSRGPNLIGVRRGSMLTCCVVRSLQSSWHLRQFFNT